MGKLSSKLYKNENNNDISLYITFTRKYLEY